LGKTENRFHFFSFFLFFPLPDRFSPFRRRSVFGNLMEPATVQIGNVCCTKFPKNGTRPPFTTVKNRKRSIKFPKIGTHPSMKFPSTEIAVTPGEHSSKKCGTKSKLVTYIHSVVSPLHCGQAEPTKDEGPRQALG
jgi:hypothetical protein